MFSSVIGLDSCFLRMKSTAQEGWRMSYTTKCKSNNSSIDYKCNSDNCILSICNRQTETGCRRAGRQDALDDAMRQTLDRLVADCTQPDLRGPLSLTPSPLASWVAQPLTQTRPLFKR